MTNWAEYWASSIKIFGKTEYLEQVGHVFKGLPYSDSQFELMVSNISQLLSLDEEDELLDLCCGNGVITHKLAEKCKRVVGVDFSKPLLDIANRDHRLRNLTYKHMDLHDLGTNFERSHGLFNKVLIFGALQYFESRDLTSLLRNIINLTANKRTILIGSIPDADRKWEFYNTPRQKFLYFFYKVTGRDLIGTWWDPNFIKKVCQPLELKCEIRKQSIDGPVSHCRFDTRIF